MIYYSLKAYRQILEEGEEDYERVQVGVKDVLCLIDNQII